MRCARCRATFEPKPRGASHAKYCNPDCRLEAYAARLARRRRALRKASQDSVTQSRRAWRVVDLLQVPKEFWWLNRDMIRRAVRRGQTIPGIVAVDDQT